MEQRGSKVIFVSWRLKPSRHWITHFFLQIPYCQLVEEKSTNQTNKPTNQTNHKNHWSSGTEYTTWKESHRLSRGQWRWSQRMPRRNSSSPLHRIKSRVTTVELHRGFLRVYTCWIHVGWIWWVCCFLMKGLGYSDGCCLFTPYYFHVFSAFRLSHWDPFCQGRFLMTFTTSENRGEGEWKRA